MNRFQISILACFAALLIFACLLVPIGTEARTGLVCIAVLGVLMLRYVKRRLTFIAAGAVLGLAALDQQAKPVFNRQLAQRLVQVGAPADLYFHPVSAFVAEFFGDVNRVLSVAHTGRVETPLGVIPAPGLAEAVS